MNKQYEVIVVQGSDISGRDVLAFVDDPAFSIKRCKGFDEFVPLHERVPAMGAVVTRGEDPAMTVARLRAADSKMVIVAVSVGDSLLTRLEVWQAGADACFSGAVTDSELFALFRNLSKRQSSASDAPGPSTSWMSLLSVIHGKESVWQLEGAGRWLTSPCGGRIPLTVTERLVVARLIAQAGQPLHRADIVAQAWANSARITPKPRCVDVMVSRLRRKAEQRNMFLPILSVRRWGYMFLPEDMAGPVTPTTADSVPPAATPRQPATRRDCRDA